MRTYYWSQTGTPTFRVAAGGELILDLYGFPVEGFFRHEGGRIGGPGLVRNTGYFWIYGGAIGVDGQAMIENDGDTRFMQDTQLPGSLLNRHLVTQRGTIDLDGLGVDRSETYGAVGLKFDIAGSWSIVGRAMLTSDVNVYFVGLRSSLY